MQPPSRHRALYTGMILGAGVWLLSPVFTGELEPWDSWGYYVVGLFFAGALAVFADPDRFWLAPVGVFLGQLVYFAVLFLAEPDPLAIIGFFVLVFCTMFAAGGSLAGFCIAAIYKHYSRRQLD